MSVGGDVAVHETIEGGEETVVLNVVAAVLTGASSDPDVLVFEPSPWVVAVTVAAAAAAAAADPAAAAAAIDSLPLYAMNLNGELSEAFLGRPTGRFWDWIWMGGGLGCCNCWISSWHC